MWWLPETRRTAQVVADMLRSDDLSMEDRQLLTTVLLDRLGALPLHARITIGENGVFLFDGKRIDPERARHLQESSKAMLTNFARRFVRESVTFLAVKHGVHDYTTPEQGLFAKAALWFYQEEDTLYRKLAGVEAEEDGQ